MFSDLRFDFMTFHLIFRSFFRPFASRMHGISRRTFISPRFGAVAMLTDSIANLNFLIPDWTEQPNHEIFDGHLHSGLDRRGSKIKISQRQIRFRHVLGVFPEAREKSLALLFNRLRLRIFWIRFPHVYRRFSARERLICFFFLAVIIDRINAGAIKGLIIKFIKRAFFEIRETESEKFRDAVRSSERNSDSSEMNGRYSFPKTLQLINQQT